MVKLEQKDDKKFNFILKLFFVISCIAFAIPSLVYYTKNKTVFKFEQWFRFLLNDSDRINQTLIYILILCAMTIGYYSIVKNRKNIFKNIKKMFLFIAIVSLIFVAVIPFTCSDVFYYLGVGRIGGTYHQNPYYTTIKQFVEQDDNSRYLAQDTVLEQGYINDWADSTVVYGPIWTLICSIVSAMSYGNIGVGLLVFKLLNVIVHMLNCYLIYKIANKKIFVLLYGLNPFVLIEGIACVHNDMFVVLFTLASFYFLLKKKKILLSILFLTFATAIKYFTIILLPFMVIYYVRNDKLAKRLLKCIGYGLLFMITLAVCYLLYIQDLSVLSGLTTQQGKLAKSIYLVMSEYFTEPQGLIGIINTILLSGFIIIYLFTCIVLISKKQIKFGKEIKKAEYFIIAFLFLLITQFQPWYIMWLFPCLMWQKSDDIRLIIQISLISQFANSVFLIYGEGWRYGTPFVFILWIGICIAKIIIDKDRIKLLKNN